MLAIVGHDGVFRRCNPAFGAHLGPRAGRLAGRPMIDFIHAEDVAETIESTCAVSAAGTPRLREPLPPPRRQLQVAGLEREFAPEEAGCTPSPTTSPAARRRGGLHDEYAFRKAMEESLITGLRAIDLSGKIIYRTRPLPHDGWSPEELVAPARLSCIGRNNRNPAA